MKRREFLGRAAAALPLLPLVGCGGGGGGPASDPSSGTGLPTGQDLPDLPRLANEGGPGTFEAHMTAGRSNIQYRSGVNTEAWTYNGVAPGPLIVVHEGDHFRVVFTNNLPQESNIHWHGLPVPADMDGLPMDVIQPGGSFAYEFDILPGTAGTYWYHPHPHHISHEQFFRGLNGMLIVRGPDPLPGDIEEKHLYISDLRLDAGGAIAPNTDGDTINGREGDHLLVNGRERPVIRIRPGTSQRWRIVNGTSARSIKLALQNHTLVVIGTDGGLLTSPVGMGELLLAPAERAEVVITANQGGPGTSVPLVALPYDRQKLVNPGASAQVTVATLTYTNDSPVSSSPVPGFLRPIAPLGEPRVVQHATFTRTAPQGAITFGMNGQIFDPNRIDLIARAGQVEEWEVTNLAGMDHPFHLHGGQFQVLSRTRSGNTVPEPFLAWKDTFNTVGGETVRFRVVQSFRGIRVFHCHIMEHESHGMMGTLQVV